MGFLAIREQNLQMKNLDVDKGIVSIKGKVYDLLYLDETMGRRLKDSLESCSDDFNSSVLHPACYDWNG